MPSVKFLRVWLNVVNDDDFSNEVHDLFLLNNKQSLIFMRGFNSKYVIKLQIKTRLTTWSHILPITQASFEKSSEILVFNPWDH